jgi:hypothetical protein
LGVLHPDMPLDWASDGDEGEDPFLAILDAFDEEFHQKTMVVRQKTKAPLTTAMQAHTLGVGKELT